jgi:hypothetical protein
MALGSSSRTGFLWLATTLRGWSAAIVSRALIYLLDSAVAAFHQILMHIVVERITRDDQANLRYVQNRRAVRVRMPHLDDAKLVAL